MRKNLSEKESVLRAIIGVILLLLGVAGYMDFVSYGSYTATASALAIILGVIMITTGFTRKCPLYKVTG